MDNKMTRLYNIILRRCTVNGDIAKECYFMLYRCKDQNKFKNIVLLQEHGEFD